MSVEPAEDEWQFKFLYITHFVVNQLFWFHFYCVDGFDSTPLKL